MTITATSLEDLLGDPADADEVFGFARCAPLDRDEAFPTEVCAHLDRLGLPEFYVPAELGGRLSDLSTLLLLIRALARRDFTVALAHCKTYLGSICVWTSGTRDQARALAERVRGGAVVSLALTEKGHGSDLLAGECAAHRVGDGYRVSGGKWLINNATRADLVCVLARTDPAGGSRGFSVLLVDRGALPAGRYEPLPSVATLGVRGADISGMTLTDAKAELIGDEGAGLEIVLKSLQVTRTLCAGMSLGLLDHGLRVAVDFALGHRMYQRGLIDLPQAGRTLAEAFADLLLAEAVALVATRSIHTDTEAQSVISALVKYLIPTRADHTLSTLAHVLGARALLTEAHAEGRFQKIERDHRIVGIFDGNTVVNLNSVINQFPSLVRGHRRGVGVMGGADLSVAPPAFDPGRLSLMSRNGCALVQGLPGMIDDLRDRLGGPVLALAEKARARSDEVHRGMAAHRPCREVPTTAFALAAGYANVFAAACAIRLWLDNPHVGPLWTDGVWLCAALARLLDEPAPEAVHDALLTDLRAQHATGRPYSLFGAVS